MSFPVRFDDSLPCFARLVRNSWGEDSIAKNVFLRDASGRLTFILVDDEHSKERRIELALAAATQLGAYVDSAGFSVATPEELFDDSLGDRAHWMTLDLDHPEYNGKVHLIDRRIVGADWLRKPERAAPAPARFVFGSLKGGVGRSTALCVVAAHLASQGRRILAIDMDLEAPGLGNLLLPEGTLPKFGLLDYLVELEVGNIVDDHFCADMTGPSWLGQGRGRVDVIPAIGQSSLSSPGNVLAKLARAYLSSAAPNGVISTFADQVRALLERLGDPSRYDAILVDARAGLHETTAAAVVSLGAEVLLFGFDQPQTFAGYELLFAHLATLTAHDDDIWQNRLHVIQSRAPRDSRAREGFAARMRDLLLKYLWRSEVPGGTLVDPSELSDTFEVEWTEERSNTVESLISAEQPPPIISILDDEQFHLFDPLSNRDALTEQYYSIAFGQLLDMAEATVTSLIEPGLAH